jgi:MFS family permease
VSSDSSTAVRRSLLRDRSFRSFFFADTVSQLGDRVSELAFPLIAVLVLHATPAQVSVLTALVWLPNLASVFVGAWIDRQPHKKRLLVIADLLRAGLLLTVPVAFALDGITLVQLYVVALLTGAAAVLFNTTYPSFFILLVDRADYLDANSKLSASRSASFVAGPALGGALVQALSAPVALLADAVSFLWSALLIARVKITRTPEPGPAEEEGATPATLWQDARSGLSYVLHDRVLRGILGCATTVNYFTFASGALVVVFASRGLDLSAGLIGLGLGIGAVGALLGALAAPALSARIGVGRTAIIGGVMFPASIGILALASGPLWSRIGMLVVSEFFSGLGVMLYDVNLNSVMATVIPDHLRSRVSGAFSAVNYGIRPLGALTGGLLATLVGLRPTLWFAAVGGSLCVLWLRGSGVPGARTLDDLVPAGAPTPGPGLTAT